MTKSVQDAVIRRTHQAEDGARPLVECQRNNGDPDHPSLMKIERGPTMLKADLLYPDHPASKSVFERGPTLNLTVEQVPKEGGRRRPTRKMTAVSTGRLPQETVVGKDQGSYPGESSGRLYVETRCPQATPMRLRGAISRVKDFAQPEILGRWRQEAAAPALSH